MVTKNSTTEEVGVPTPVVYFLTVEHVTLFLRRVKSMESCIFLIIVNVLQSCKSTNDNVVSYVQFKVCTRIHYKNIKI